MGTAVGGKFSSERGHLFDQSGVGKGEDLKTLGKRKYLYNPLVFDNEGQYAEFYERMNSGVYKLSQDSVNKILVDNKAKMNIGEDMQKPCPMENT